MVGAFRLASIRQPSTWDRSILAPRPASVPNCLPEGSRTLRRVVRPRPQNIRSWILAGTPPCRLVIASRDEVLQWCVEGEAGEPASIDAQARTQTHLPAAPAAPLFKSLGFFCAFPCPVPEPNAPILARAAPVGCNSRLFGAWNPSNGAFHGQDVDSSGLSTRPGVTGRPVSQWACMIISPSPAVPKRAQIHCRILACPTCPLEKDNPVSSSRVWPSAIPPGFRSSFARCSQTGSHISNIFPSFKPTSRPVFSAS
jgi:hypothetical protein